MNPLKLSTTICRNSSSLCDLPEYCTGNSSICPADSIANSSVLCRPNTTVCGILFIFLVFKK